jgi:hypothetical protein
MVNAVSPIWTVNADRPQDHDKHRCRQNRRCGASGEFNRRLCRESHVVGDATFGIPVGAAHKIELIIAAVLEPAIDEELIEPLAPSALHRHARAKIQDAQKHTARQKGQVEHRQL